MDYVSSPICKVYIVVDNDNEDFFRLTYEKLKDVDNISLYSIATSPVNKAEISSKCLKHYDLSTITPGCYWLALIREFYDSSPTLFVKAGSDLPKDAIVRLLGLAKQHSASAVMPLLARHCYFSAFEENTSPSLSVQNIDKWVNQLAETNVIDVPVLSDSIAFLNGNSWIEVARRADVRNDRELFLCQIAAGSRMLLSNQLYVDDSRVGEIEEVLFVDSYGEALIARHPFTGLRHAVTQLSKRKEPAPKFPLLPVRLHVTHSWGGGLGRWVEDFTESDQHHHTLVLRSIGIPGAPGQALALYDSAAMRKPLKTYPLSMPILSTSIDNYTYELAIKEIIAEYSVDSIVVSSLIGHALNALSTGLPTVYVFHDFYPVCPALVATFDSPCMTCNGEKLSRCKNTNPFNRFFMEEPASYWLTLREHLRHRLLQPFVELVAPSRSVVGRMLSLDPGMREKPVTVIEHGLPEEFASRLRAVSEAEEADSGPLKIVVLGSMTAHKGADILKEAISHISTFANVYVLGCGEEGKQFEKYKNATVIKYYDKNSLPQHLSSIQADIGVLLSLVPETFSYTLSELFAAAIPVVATRLGAFEDRINNSNGWLIDPSGLSLVQQLIEINHNRKDIYERKLFLKKETVKTSIMMVLDYDHLEAQLANRVGRYAQPVIIPGAEIERSPTDNPGYFVDRQAPFRLVLADFLAYTAAKVRGTSRIPEFLKKPLIKVLLFLSRRHGSPG